MCVPDRVATALGCTFGLAAVPETEGGDTQNWQEKLTWYINGSIGS
jgi:hypothetical protein